MTVDTSPEPTSQIPEIPADPRPAEYQRLAREIASVEAGRLEPLRMAMLSSTTLDLLRPSLVVEGAREGFQIDLTLGNFGQLEQPLLDESGRLYQAEPDVLVLLFQPGDIAPDVIDRYYATEGRHLDELCDELTERLIAAARIFRERAGRPVLVGNYATPAALPLGPFDAGDPDSLTHRLSDHNRKLARAVRDEPDAYVWDYAGLVRQAGSARWSDPRLRMLARAAVASERLPEMARHLVRATSALRRRPAKCLVLDLDNTLWGGVVGDDGVQGLRLGDDWPGVAFKTFQRTVLGLRDRGILLAVVSKNDEEVAREAFSSHPEMLIGWEDLAAVRINWEPKSANMQSIAEELNIGADSLVLFDDNPVERAEVRAGLPEAGVIEVPTDPSGYADALLSSGLFDQVSLSAEDRGRADMYRVERKRTDLRQASSNMEDFLRSLEMRAEVADAGSGTMARIAQLVGKTNQFNLTTRRHPPAEIDRLNASDDAAVTFLRLRDRFGDQGLVAVGILERRDDEAWIDTFLMSCRVMNRGVERAMMAFLAERAQQLGCRRLVGEYIRTAKNNPVTDFFSDLGFSHVGESSEGSLWQIESSEAAALWPPHIERVDYDETAQETA